MVPQFRKEKPVFANLFMFPMGAKNEVLPRSTFGVNLRFLAKTVDLLRCEETKLTWQKKGDYFSQSFLKASLSKIAGFGPNSDQTPRNYILRKLV